MNIYLLILLCGQPAVIGLATSVDPALWTASSDPLTLITLITILTLRILKKYSFKKDDVDIHLLILLCGQLAVISLPTSVM